MKTIGIEHGLNTSNKKSATGRGNPHFGGVDTTENAGEIVRTQSVLGHVGGGFVYASLCCRYKRTPKNE